MVEMEPASNLGISLNLIDSKTLLSSSLVRVEFNKAWAEGRAMTLEQALAEAMEEN